MKNIHPQAWKPATSTTMKFQIFTLSVLLIVPLLSEARLYRWVDEAGKVHYSDSVPPHMSQKGHVEMDKLGNKLKKVEAAKSSEQVEEEKWIEELEGKLSEKKAQQRRKDELLLNSYADLETFDKLYEERFNVLLEERKQLELLQAKLGKELERLQVQLTQAKKAASKKRVQGFIDINLENTESYTQAIATNRNEEKNLRDEASQLRKRFIYLLSKLEKKNEDEKSKNQ